MDLYLYYLITQPCGRHVYIFCAEVFVFTMWITYWVCDCLSISSFTFFPSLTILEKHVKVIGFGEMIW